MKKDYEEISDETLKNPQQNNYIKNNDENVKEPLICIELCNNNRIYIKYELKWTIKDLIKNIVNHYEFKKLYSSREWIFNSRNHLSLFDVHLTLFRKIKSDNETKVDFNEWKKILFCFIYFGIHEKIQSIHFLFLKIIGIMVN